MFKLQDCFVLSGVFNEALIKRFKENYNPEKGSRLWMIPGHIIYTTSDLKVFTCDARPLDLLSPSEPCTGELISPSAPVFEIFCESETVAPRMYIVLNNGDVQIFEYRALLYEWARVGYFNVNITSPNAPNTRTSLLTKFLISPQQNTIYWAEETASGDMNLNLYKRTLPASGVREITQSTLGPVQMLLKNCPNFDIIDIQDNVCIRPKLSNSVNLYFILSARCYLWIFDICGKCLWRGIIGDEPLDFKSLCIKCVGLWSQSGNIKVCHLLHTNNKLFFILHDNILLSVTGNGEIEKEVKVPFIVDNLCEYYILWNVLCVYDKNTLKLYSILNGKLLQTFELQNDIHVHGIWFHRSSMPCFGFHTDSSILLLQPQSLQTILHLKSPSYLKVLHILAQNNIHYFTLMKDIINFKNDDLYLEPLQNIPNAFQSKALLLTLIQLCREKSIDVKNFPFSKEIMEDVLSPSNDEFKYSDTKLKEMLEPFIECYCKLERAKNKNLNFR